MKNLLQKFTQINFMSKIKYKLNVRERYTNRTIKSIYNIMKNTKK